MYLGREDLDDRQRMSERESTRDRQDRLEHARTATTVTGEPLRSNPAYVPPISTNIVPGTTSSTPIDSTRNFPNKTVTVIPTQSSAPPTVPTAPNTVNNGGVITPTQTAQPVINVSTPSSGSVAVPVVEASSNTLLWLGIGLVGLLALGKKKQ